MASYTGTVKSVRPDPGELFPLVNPHMQNHTPANRLTLQVYAAELKGTSSAIGTDDYTYTLFVAGRSLVVAACYVVDPVGLSVDVNNYNTLTLYNDTTKLCEATTKYGLVAHLPFELTRANSVANRTLSAGDTVTLKIAGTSSGRVITPNTKVYVVCYWA